MKNELIKPTNISRTSEDGSPRLECWGVFPSDPQASGERKSNPWYTIYSQSHQGMCLFCEQLVLELGDKKFKLIASLWHIPLIDVITSLSPLSHYPALLGVQRQ
jgi:hypothetical protein